MKIFCRMFVFYVFANFGFSAGNSLPSEGLKLELLQAVFRHGDRTPRLIEAYPNDIYNETAYEPFGLGQLTKKGILREYSIGTILRKRFDEFLGPYRAGDAYPFSTNSDRTKVSLLSLLAGLYPPYDDQKVNDINWQAIPTYTIPVEMDNVFNMRACDSFKEAFKKFLEEPEAKQQLSAYDDLTTYIANHSGLGHIDDSKKLVEFYGVFESQASMDLPPPDWLTKDIMSRLKDYYKLHIDLESARPNLERLNAGPIVKKLLKNIKRNNDRDIDRKIYLYGIHDAHVGALARTLKIPDFKIPRYGSTIVLEKLRNDAGNEFVRVGVINDGVEDYKITKMQNCDELCPLDQFHKNLKDVIPAYQETLCLFRKDIDLAKIFDFDRKNFNTVEPR